MKDCIKLTEADLEEMNTYDWDALQARWDAEHCVDDLVEDIELVFRGEAFPVSGDHLKRYGTK